MTTTTETDDLALPAGAARAAERHAAELADEVRVNTEVAEAEAEAALELAEELRTVLATALSAEQRARGARAALGAVCALASIEEPPIPEPAHLDWKHLRNAALAAARHFDENRTAHRSRANDLVQAAERVRVVAERPKQEARPSINRHLQRAVHQLGPATERVVEPLVAAWLEKGRRDLVVEEGGQS